MESVKLFGEQQKYNAALYCRLSRDDGLDSISSSIQSQMEYLTDYAKKNHLNIVDYYCDDGYSGTTFERPEFKRLIKDIELQRINCVITKDLSRLGRNYIQTGYYTEEYFPNKNIRYIAINDNFDTESEVEDDFAPFKNIINEWYAKDISKKVRSTFAVKRDNGEMVCGFPLYGYQYLNGSTKRVISEDEANVVRLIFDLFIDGKSCLEISRYLSEHKINTPRYSYYKKYQWFKNYFVDIPQNSNSWSPDIVRNIIKNEEYTGKVILNKQQKLSFKSKTRKKTPESNLIYSTAPAIIPVETFLTAKRIFERNKFLKVSIEPDYLRGLVYCPICKKRMTFSKKTIKNREGTMKKYEYMAYICRNKGCKQKTVKQSGLNTIIIQEMNCLKEALIHHQNDFLSIVKNEIMKRSQEESLIHKLNENKIKQLKIDSDAVDKKLEYLISGRTTGVIPISTYQSLLKKYSLEKESLESSITELKENQHRHQALDIEASCQGILAILLTHDGKFILENNFCNTFIKSIFPEVEKKYFPQEKTTRNTIKCVEINYLKPGNILEELEQWSK